MALNEARGVGPARWTLLPSDLIGRIGTALGNRRRRARFARMAELEPRILDDIGMTAEDIAWGLSLPIESNAAVEVQRRRAFVRRDGLAR